MSSKLDPKRAEEIMLLAGLKPLEPYTNALAKWRCIHLECGEEVFAVLNQIRKGQGGCKKCGIRKRSKSQMLPAEDALKIMLEANLEPLEPYSGSHSPWKSRCMKCDKEVSPKLNSIKQGQGGCKYCAKRFVDADDAKALMIKNGFIPLEDYKGAGNPWKCECARCGFVSTPTFANVQNGSICSKCANKESGLQRRIPEKEAIKILEKSGLEPLESYNGTKSPWKSKCLNCGNIVKPTLGNLIQGHSGCAYCSGHIVKPDYAEKIMVDSGLIPLEPYKNSSAPWKCKHTKCGEIVSPSYASVRRGQGGCRKCGYIAGSFKNLYPVEEAIALMEKANYKPLEPFVKAGIPWMSECVICHKVVFPTLSNVKNGKSKCIYCSKMKVDESDAIILMNKFGFQPLEPYKDSKTKWKCVHLKCGNIVYPLYNTIQNRKTGCIYCANYGLKFSEPAYLYIMEHKDFRSIKVGISNNDAKPNRIKSHEKQGWIFLGQFQFDNGQIADYVENQIFSWIRNVKKLGVHLTKDMMKQGGYTETIDAAEIDYMQIYRKLETIIETLEN
ncbi:MAG: hypothetical protein EBU66_16445 [Bacteroidetes bacterium]|nr:hypothetical protein [bacterium]NBP66227.1 hypothetical protein [Bacteroidota bacterium]